MMKGWMVDKQIVESKEKPLLSLRDPALSIKCVAKYGHLRWFWTPGHGRHPRANVKIKENILETQAETATIRRCQQKSDSQTTSYGATLNSSINTNKVSLFVPGVWIRCSIFATRVTLFVIGYLWMLVIPLPGLGRDTYIDENALQPSQVRRREACSMFFNILWPQVNTYWNWGNVHTADLYLTQLEQIREANFTSKQSASNRLVLSTCFDFVF